LEIDVLLPESDLRRLIRTVIREQQESVPVGEEKYDLGLLGPVSLPKPPEITTWTGLLKYILPFTVPELFDDASEQEDFREEVNEIQEILGVQQTGKWDAATEASWARTLKEKNPKLTGATVDSLIQSWIDYLSQVTQVNGESKSYESTPAGALQFLKDIMSTEPDARSPYAGAFSPDRLGEPEPQLPDITVGTKRIKSYQDRFYKYDKYFYEAAQETGLPFGFIKAVSIVESGLKPDNQSSAAQGIMQFIPSTARSQGLTNPFDPVESIRIGGRYLKKKYDEFGSLELALSGYNEGSGATRSHIRQHGRSVHPGAVDYANKVMAIYEFIKEWQPQYHGGGLPPASMRSDFEIVDQEDLPQGKASKYFDFSDLTKSKTAKSKGLSNTPEQEELQNLSDLARNVLDPLNDKVGGKIRISSAYRSPAVNSAVGGAKGSQHMKGQAADITVSGMDALELANLIVSMGLPFDQIIWYAPSRGGHVHVSYNEGGNRRKTTHAPSKGGYVNWTPDVSPGISFEASLPDDPDEADEDDDFSSLVDRATSKASSAFYSVFPSLLSSTRNETGDLLAPAKETVNKLSEYGFKPDPNPYDPTVKKRYCEPGTNCKPRAHYGVDLTRKRDNLGAPLVAVLDGVVDEAPSSMQGGNGFIVKIKHGDFKVIYKHMKQPAIVSEGQSVRAGQRVGYMGDTGISSAPHLHFGVYTQGGGTTEPLTWLEENAVYFPISPLFLPSGESINEHDLRLFIRSLL
jgi:zinc D-Ala-D-Ala carboxypeptidase